MEFPLTRRRAERVDALLRGARQAATPDDEHILAAVTALSGVPPPVMRPDFRAALRARLLAEPCGAGSTPVSGDAADAADAAASPSGHPTAQVARRPGARADRPPRRRAGRIVRPALVGVLASSVAAVGVGVASRGALPGEPLYGVKRQVERVQVGLAGDDVEQAEERLELARTRLGEVRALVADAGSAHGELPALFRAWRQDVDSGSGVLLERAGAGDTAARSTLAAFTAEQSAELTELLQTLPEGTENRRAAQSAFAVVETLNARLGVAEMPPGAQGAEPGGPAPAGGPLAPPYPAPTTPPGTPSPSPTATPEVEQRPTVGASDIPAAPTFTTFPTIPEPPDGFAPPTVTPPIRLPTGAPPPSAEAQP